RDEPATLPAGLDQTRNVAAHCGFAQLVTRKTELAIYTVRTTSQAAAVAQTRGTRITRLLLQGDLGFPTLLRTAVRIGDDSLQLGTLLGVLGYRLLTLQLTVLHARFGHVRIL